MRCIEAQRKGQAASSGSSKSFDNIKEKMGTMVNKPMTRDEAIKILAIDVP